MKEEILVKVVARKGRTNLVYRWEDRKAGTQGEQSAGTAKRTAAYKGIPAFIREVILPKRQDKPTWEQAKELYQQVRVSRWREQSKRCWRSAYRKFEEVCSPVLLEDVTLTMVDTFQVRCREELAFSSMASYLRQLKAFLRFCGDRFPYAVPKIPSLSSTTHGRPLTAAEFRKLLGAVDTVVEAKWAVSWKNLLKGLVHSGLRLNQALQLSTDPQAPIRIEGLDGTAPHLLITPEAHKGKRLASIPLIPPMVALVRSLLASQGNYGDSYVFHPEGAHGPRRNMQGVSATIAAIGEASGVVTGTKTKEGKTVNRYPTAHDLRRTFIKRLVRLGLHPGEIIRFSQHKNWTTAENAYLDQDAMQLGDRVRKLFRKRKKNGGAESGDLAPEG
jgi:integrase